MRFSSIFQIPIAPRPGRPVEAVRVEEPGTPRPAPAVAVAELPDDLDQRVRLVGEWQLGEA